MAVSMSPAGQHGVLNERDYFGLLARLVSSSRATDTVGNICARPALEGDECATSKTHVKKRG